MTASPALHADDLLVFVIRALEGRHSKAQGNAAGGALGWWAYQPNRALKGRRI
jgi:hypothetical protein